MGWKYLDEPRRILTPVASNAMSYEGKKAARYVEMVCMCNPISMLCVISFRWRLNHVDVIIMIIVAWSSWSCSYDHHNHGSMTSWSWWHDLHDHGGMIFMIMVAWSSWSWWCDLHDHGGMILMIIVAWSWWSWWHDLDDHIGNITVAWSCWSR